MSPIWDSDLFFTGTRGLSSEEFIRGIRKTSLTAEKEGDDYWMAMVVASSLGGLALIWYEEQDEQIQNSWRLLRRAMFSRWPIVPEAYDVQSISSRASSAVTMPTPTTITSSSTVRAPTTQGGSSFGVETPHTGRIRVTLEGGTPFGYIATKTDANGDCTTTKFRDEGLVVRFTPFLYKPHEMITVGSGTATTSYFGMSWGSEWSSVEEIDNNLAERKIMWGGMGYLTTSPSGFSTTGSAGGPKKATIFNVMLDGTIGVSWESENGALYHIHTAICIHPGFPDHGSIQTTNNFPELVALPAATKQGFSFSDVNLVFEPL